MTNKKDMSIGRRNFLKHVLVAGGAAGVGAAGGFGALSHLAAQSAGAQEKFYVYGYFSGGWDTLLGIDPRDPAVFNADNVGQTRIMPGYGNQAAVEFQEAPMNAPGTSILLGPAARPLDAVADRLAVVRGMSMDTLTHEVGRRRFLTGKPPSGLNARGSSGSSWLASQYDGSRLIPNLSVRIESFNPDLPPDVSALRVGSSTDLVAMLRRRDPTMDEALDTSVAQLLEDEASCARALSSPTLRSAESARQRMRAVLDADVQALFDFRSDDPDIVALRDHFGFTTGQLTSGAAQAALAYQAITQGVSRVVSIQAAGGLDTHFDNWEDDAGPRQRDGWLALTNLATRLQDTEYPDGSGDSYLDRTVIIGFSEFMRTPLINARGGRDHWLTGSCALIGGSIRGGTVIGASSDVGMSPQLVNRETGAVVESATEGEVIYPEHVLRTLLVDAGLEEDRADLRVEPIPAMLNG